MRYFPRAERDYEVLLTPYPEIIKGLGCNYCSYFNSRLGFKKSRSGLGRYNRMRADMVRHIYRYHPDIVKQFKNKERG